MFRNEKMTAVKMALAAGAVLMSAGAFAQAPESRPRTLDPAVGFEIAEQGNRALRIIQQEARVLSMPALSEDSVIAAQPGHDQVFVAGVSEDAKRLRLAH